MKNDYIIGDIKISIPPTILISVIGKIENASSAVTMDIKRSDEHVYILGNTKKELGGSEYLASHGLLGSSVPKVDAASAIRRYRNLNRAIKRGIISAAHDLSDGGLGVCLAEMAFAGGYGMEINLEKVPIAGALSETEILYSETSSRIIVTLSSQHTLEFEDIFGDDASCIGKTIQEQRLIVKGASALLIDTDLETLRQAWKEPLDFSL